MSSLWNGLLNLLGATLTFFYGLVPNFGVAIMLLTIAIGLVLFPLTLKQTRSMKAMQEIQPEIKRLQKEFKGDRAAQQQAMMALYRERGVNPAAGCLPMLLQMPIWFGLFSVLRSFAANSSNPLKYVTEGSALESAIEAGKSLNFLWMNLAISPSDALRGNENLEISGGIATALPYLITIAIVVASAYWQQKQTQARQQSGQAQPGQGLMKVFPFLFGFISFNLPAGLVVYFASSQLFRVGQQSLILGIDTKRAEAQPAKPRGGPPERTPKPESKSEPGSDHPGEARRRPPQQGSKKKRGKKRRRR